MMQRGVDLSDLDVSYVSSLALYFLLMFGLNDVYAILLGEGSEMDEQRMMQMQVSIGSYMSLLLGWLCSAVHRHSVVIQCVGTG
jgi:Integral membrane protein EMC3/TMCO1-like